MYQESFFQRKISANRLAMVGMTGGRPRVVKTIPRMLKMTPKRYPLNTVINQ